MDVTTAALGYRARGFFCVPIPTGEKGPRIKEWQNLRLEESALRDAFTQRTGNVGLVLGEPSGWLVDVDLDCPEAIELAEKFLPATGAITGRTGRERSHWWYFCEGIETKKEHDKLAEKASTVELRSTGAQTVVGPSMHPDGSTYEILTGEPAKVQAGMLSACVSALHQAILKERGHEDQSVADRYDGNSGKPRGTGKGDCDDVHGIGPNHRKPLVASSQRQEGAIGRSARPGDDYNERGDLHSLLLQHGWTVFGKSGNNVQLTRPGKSSGLSATWNGEHFYVFSSSCPQFEPEKGYRPFEVYTRLEHNGDHTAAAAQLGRDGFGSNGGLSGIDLSRFHFGNDSEVTATTKSQAPDAQSSPQGMGGIEPDSEKPKQKTPVEFPPHLLKVPGFVGQVVQYSLETAHRPQPLLSMWAALCLQAVLSARKICDPYGARTNLYVIAMAGSGKGKDHPRVVNRRILTGSGLLELEGPEDLASDSGLLAALAHQPGLLMQLDEIGRLLKVCSANGASAGHLYGIPSQLLRLYSSTGEMYQGKAYADRTKNNPIDQPCLTIYGSTVPDSFWGSMSSEAIDDGLLARMMPVIGEEKPEKQLARQVPVPESILMHAQGWGGYRPNGILGSVHPAPTTVEYTVEAEQILKEYDDIFEKRGDDSGAWQPIWVRAKQKAQSLALIYVASKGTKNLRIDAEAIQWACEVSEWSSSLFESVGDHHIADSEFERKCQRVYQTIAKCGQKGMTSNRLCGQRCWRAMPPRDRQEVITTLIGDGRVEIAEGPRGGQVYVANS